METDCERVPKGTPQHRRDEGQPCGTDRQDDRSGGEGVYHTDRLPVSDAVDYSNCMVDVPAPIATHTPAGMTVTLNQEIINLDNTLSHGKLSSAEKADLFPRFWVLINIAITYASQVPRVRAEEEDNGRRDERENGGQEPEEELH